VSCAELGVGVNSREVHGLNMRTYVEEHGGGERDEYEYLLACMFL